MSCEHFFFIWGCQKQARVNSGKGSMSDDASAKGLGATEDKLVRSKKIEKLPRIPKIGARSPAKA